MLFVGGLTALAAAVSAAVCVSGGCFAGLSWLWVLPLTFFGTFLAGLVLFFLMVLVMAAAVKMDGPFEEDNKFYRFVAEQVIDAVIFLMRIRISTSGMEKLPKEGRFLLVSNHRDDVDPAVLLHLCKKKDLVFISKRENDAKPVIGPFLRKIMCQPINRENDREALKTILKCIQLIKEDRHSVAVFPEGYIYDDLKLHRFRHGVFKIAQKADVPIVVCTLRDTPEVLPRMKKLKSSRVEVRLLEVISAEAVKASSTVDLGDRIYEMMAADLGPDLVAQE